MTKTKGCLITFEGIECSGKGEQSSRLFAYLKQLGIPVILTREPGGTIYGEALRAILKYPELALGSLIRASADHEYFPQNIDVASQFYRSAYCELFMFLAARAELARGKVIIVDRFFDSTRAYQGGGRFFSQPEMIDTISQLNKVALQGVKPDLTFFLDITVEEMIKRRGKITDKDAHFEKTCNREFFERTRNEYLNIADDEPNRFMIINGAKSIEFIHQEIIRLITVLIGEV